MVVEVTSPVRLWHGLQEQATRSQAAYLNFAVEAASGGSWLQSLKETIMVLQDLPKLHRMGLSCSTSTQPPHQLTLDHPL
eukprot:10604991-Prorocentrum_lima.AAC.1